MGQSGSLSVCKALKSLGMISIICNIAIKVSKIKAQTLSVCPSVTHGNP